MAYCLPFMQLPGAASQCKNDFEMLNLYAARNATYIRRMHMARHGTSIFCCLCALVSKMHLVSYFIFIVKIKVFKILEHN